MLLVICVCVPVRVCSVEHVNLDYYAAFLGLNTFFTITKWNEHTKSNEILFSICALFCDYSLVLIIAVFDLIFYRFFFLEKPSLLFKNIIAIRTSLDKLLFDSGQ